MKKIEMLLFSLKGSVTLVVESKDGNIDSFVYELFTSLDHYIDEKNQSIQLNQKQCNDENTIHSINELVKKYASTVPQINNLSKFIKTLDRNEYFFAIVLLRQLTQEEVFNMASGLMSLNVPEFDIMKHMQQSNELFKNVWDNYLITATNNEKKYRIGESDKKKRICRFCGRAMSSGALFRNEAHAISEALGNKTVIFNEECDECNSYFDQEIERNFITYLSLYRTFFGIMNKSNKVPSIKGKNFEYRNMGNRNIELRFVSEERETAGVEPPKNILLKFNETIISQNIYKTLVKYSLSVLENIIPGKFTKTIEWIRNPIFKEKLPKVGVLASYAFFKENPNLLVYIRKNENKLLPYAVGEFHFTFLTFVFIIPTFSELESDFTDDADFSRFWEFFKHFNMSKEFKFDQFSDSVERNVQFNLSFEQVEKE
jgi:HNH endonuclease